MAQWLYNLWVDDFATVKCWMLIAEVRQVSRHILGMCKNGKSHCSLNKWPQTKCKVTFDTCLPKIKSLGQKFGSQGPNQIKTDCGFVWKLQIFYFGAKLPLDLKCLVPLKCPEVQITGEGFRGVHGHPHFLLSWEKRNLSIWCQKALWYPQGQSQL